MSAAARGDSQDFPRLPDPDTGAFVQAPSGDWFDPPLADGYDFKISGTSLFTDILAFPVGIDGDGKFEVWTGNTRLGEFSVGQSVRFDPAVSSFHITGIDPAVNGSNPEAFPIRLAFNTPTASFTMKPRYLHPTVTQEPQSALVAPGGIHTFNVSASGSAPITYQWQFNNADIPGATAATLSLSHVTLAQQGSYRCVASNAYGRVYSDPALLTVANFAQAKLLAYWPFNDASVPSQALDAVQGLPGTVTGTYSADGGGQTGDAGDRALCFTPNQNMSANGAFANQASAGDRISVVFWQKLATVRNSTAFLFTSPSSGLSRGLSAHSPWGDGKLYFDHGGCCTADVHRISGPLPAMDVTQWHHFAFIKDGTAKRVYVDGVLALSGVGTAPLPGDFTQIFVGSANGVDYMSGWLDDFAVFADALAPDQITRLAGGETPAMLAGEKPGDFASWKTASAPGQADSEDTDSDGLSNFWEYVIGGTNGACDAGRLPSGGRESFSVEGTTADYPTLTATIRRNTPDVQLFPESGTDFTDWTTSEMVFVRRTENADGTDTYTWRHLRPFGEVPRTLMCLRAVVP